jgi:hypothetical protein
MLPACSTRRISRRATGRSRGTRSARRRPRRRDRHALVARGNALIVRFWQRTVDTDHRPELGALKVIAGQPAELSVDDRDVGAAPRRDGEIPPPTSAVCHPQPPCRRGCDAEEHVVVTHWLAVGPHAAVGVPRNPTGSAVLGHSRARERLLRRAVVLVAGLGPALATAPERDGNTPPARLDVGIRIERGVRDRAQVTVDVNSERIRAPDSNGPIGGAATSAAPRIPGALASTS